VVDRLKQGGVTLDIADEVARRFSEADEVSDSVLQFVEEHRR